MLYFKATHSNGHVSLRASKSRSYSWAIVTGNSVGASFSSRQDLARKEADRLRQWYPNVEAVPAVEITKAEHDAILKGGKQFFTFIVEGKKVVRSRPAGQTPLVGMFVEVYEEHAYRVDLSERASDEAKTRSIKNADGSGYHYFITNRAHIVRHEFFEADRAKYEAKVAGTWAPTDGRSPGDKVGERGLVKRYIVKPE